MAREPKKKNKRLANVEPSKISDAQIELDKFCNQCGMKPFKITAGKADWKELVLRHCGLPPKVKEYSGKKIGRPAWSNEEIARIGGHVEALEHFNDEKRKLKELYALAAKQTGVKSSAKGAKDDNTSEIVRGLYNKRKQLRKTASNY